MKGLTRSVLVSAVAANVATAFLVPALPQTTLRSHRMSPSMSIPLELEGQLDSSKKWDVELTLDGETKTLSIPEGTSVLEAAEMAFDDPPFSCRNGVCTTCSGKVLAGEESIKMAVHGLGADLRAAGFTLTCQTFPAGEGVKVLLNQYDTVYYEQYGKYEAGEVKENKKLFGLF
ncbi:unnamed protein product [Chrysoparadoxa australica]